MTGWDISGKAKKKKAGVTILITDDKIHMENIKRNNRIFCVDLIIHNEYLTVINILEHSNIIAMSLKQKFQDMQEK